MPKDSIPKRAGLDVSITEDDDGTWHLTLTDDSGSEVMSRSGYKTVDSARSGAAQWVNRHYEVPTVEVPLRGGASKDTGSNAQLVKVMRRKAQANDDQAAKLRADADRLEVEAKRLHAAADVLEGPEG